ncbi:transposase [Kitasatospora cathayae]|uniref:transposase n=1 Tax=Kitasatospora cathayae TaxID=3004092 RepID=UPI00386017EC
MDLLPERDAATLAPWLAAHPQIEVICRDRASAYAEAADTAAPQARQVADRYHLWANLVRAVERTVMDHRACLTSLPVVEPEPEPQWEAPLPTGSDTAGPANPTGRMADRRREHHALVHQLLASGMSLREVARHLGWGRHTVQRYARAKHWQDMVKGQLPPERASSTPTRPTSPSAGRRPKGRSPAWPCWRRSNGGATGAATRSSPSRSSTP